MHVGCDRLGAGAIPVEKHEIPDARPECDGHRRRRTDRSDPDDSYLHETLLFCCHWHPASILSSPAIGRAIFNVPRRTFRSFQEASARAQGFRAGARPSSAQHDQ